MLKIDQAHRILEVACGTGKLIPYIIQIKEPSAYYLASDLSLNMV
jgi:ubiquinone/menaquinone biosynthesis C-methylase UbiE